MTKERLYTWVRVDVATLTGMGVVVGVGFWPVPDHFYPEAERRFVSHVRKAVREWIATQDGDPDAKETNYVKCAEVQLQGAMHAKLMERFDAWDPSCALQIYPCRYGLPLPEGLIDGER